MEKVIHWPAIWRIPGVLGRGESGSLIACQGGRARHTRHTGSNTEDPEYPIPDLPISRFRYRLHDG